MGNINKESLLDMIFKFKNTFPGHYMFSDSNCHDLRNFLPEKFKWRCEFCKDRFFINANKTPEEALGRELIKVTAESNFNQLFEQLLEKKKSVPQKEYEREFLLSFTLTKKDLNENMGEKIKNFLDKLKDNKIRFTLSRPLPPCLGKITDDSQPKNCFECRELFTVDNGFIRFCEPFKKVLGPEFKQLKNRDQLYTYFASIHERMEILYICKSCLYHIRGLCNGLCFVK
jgi:hypothetical protein